MERKEGRGREKKKDTEEERKYAERDGEAKPKST